MPTYRMREPEKEAALMDKAKRALRDLYDFYTSHGFTNSARYPKKAIALLNWIRQV